VNTVDDWQKSQWLPPRLAQGTRVIRQVSCGRRRVGEVGEDRSRLTVEQNVFSRALGATPFKTSSASQAVRHQCCVFFCEFNLTVVVAVAFGAEMLHSFLSNETSGGRRRRSAHPDRTGCLTSPSQTPSQTPTVYRRSRNASYLQSFPHGKWENEESVKCPIWKETWSVTQRKRLDFRLSGRAFRARRCVPPQSGTRNERAMPEHDRHSCKEFRVEYL